MMTLLCEICKGWPGNEGLPVQRPQEPGTFIFTRIVDHLCNAKNIRIDREQIAAKRFDDVFGVTVHLFFGRTSTG